MEGDPVSSGKTIRQSISIHSLRMEGDEMSTVSEYVGEVFQSTPSAWRETDTLEAIGGDIETFQSTPSAWRETKQP